MTKIDLDLDVLAPPDRTFRLAGRTYRLPGDLPARTVVKFMRLGSRMQAVGDEDVESNAGAMEEMTDLVAGLIARYNPGSTRDEIADLLSLQALQQVMALAVGGQPEQELPDAVVDTLTAGRIPEAAEVDREDPTASHPETPAAA